MTCYGVMEWAKNYQCSKVHFGPLMFAALLFDRIWEYVVFTFDRFARPFERPNMVQGD